LKCLRKSKKRKDRSKIKKKIRVKRFKDISMKLQVLVKLNIKMKMDLLSQKFIIKINNYRSKRVKMNKKEVLLLVSRNAKIESIIRESK